MKSIWCLTGICISLVNFSELTPDYADYIQQTKILSWVCHNLKGSFYNWITLYRTKRILNKNVRKVCAKLSPTPLSLFPAPFELSVTIRDYLYKSLICNPEVTFGLYLERPIFIFISVHQMYITIEKVNGEKINEWLKRDRCYKYFYADKFAFVITASLKLVCLLET